MFTGERCAQPAAIAAAVDDVLRRIRNDASVLAAGASTWALPSPAGALRQISLPSADDRRLPASVRRGFEAVTPEYFAALAAPLNLGRSFTDSDRAGSTPVGLVNDALAAHLWPGKNPIGEWVRLGTPGEDAPVVLVVGVVASMRRSAMHDQPIAVVYLPLAQHPNPGVTFVVRTRGDTGKVAGTLDAAVQAADSSLVTDRARTVESEVGEFVAPVRVMSSLLGAFGVTGMLLAGLGIFGTMSYTVAQQQRELAIRAALALARRISGGSSCEPCWRSRPSGWPPAWRSRSRRHEPSRASCSASRRSTR